MSRPQLIGPRLRTSPPRFTLVDAHGGDLPDDLLRQASRRLGVAGVTGAVLWTFGTITAHLNDRWLHLDIPSSQVVLLAIGPAASAIAGAGVLVSLGLFLYAYKGARDPRLTLDLGLVYLVLMALALGMIFHLDDEPAATAISPQMSWIGAVILMFAAMVPTSPRRMFGAGMMAAAMNPFAMLVLQGKGVGLDGLGRALMMHYPDFILVGVAVVISHVVTQLGRQVSRERELGSYRLGELLGRGGMGEVYRATHRMLKRPAAIKLIRPEMLGEERGAAARVVVARFHREAEAAANLSSPHTVQLYDFGVAQDGTLYLVMELLQGMDLDELVRQKGPLPAARVIHLLRQACESLEEAHRAGMVHRDIKPANLHVGRVGLQHDFVKVLDFGLVKSLEGASGSHSMETAAGLTPGTPAYMAPEMALDKTVDARADVYALGAVAYYLLTGPQVFEAPNHIQMIAKHLQEPPTVPSLLAELVVPPALDELVLSCLAKNPEQRPASAAALARALAAIDVEPWTAEQAAAWWQVNLPAPRGAALAAPRLDLTERGVPEIASGDQTTG